MDNEQEFKGRGYNDVLTWYYKYKQILYRALGSGTGEWLYIGKDDTQYYFHKGMHGSCAACDAFQATFAISIKENQPITYEQVKKFVDHDDTRAEMTPFVEVPIDMIKQMCREDSIMTVLPKNLRGNVFGGENIDIIAIEATALIRLEESMPLYIEDIFNVKNQEIKHQYLKAFGLERFIKEGNGQLVSQDDYGKLYKVISKQEKGNSRDDEVMIVIVKCATTDREFPLRVPNNMRKAKEAVAWTFGLREDQYNPSLQT